MKPGIIISGTTTAPCSRKMTKELNIQYGIDAVKELEDILTEELKKSIDPKYKSKKVRELRKKKLDRIFNGD